VNQDKESPSEYGDNPAGITRRWLMEIDLAAKRDKDYIKTGEAIYKKYRGTGRKANSFNILYSNTETLSSALYNAPPKPDVRRRFKDPDPVAKVAAKLLERSISFSIDNDEFTDNLSRSVLDLLLPGRGLARVRYVPQFMASEQKEEIEEAEQSEELAWQQTKIEHVAWKDFRMSAGKTWPEVTWIAFRYRMTRDELVEKFGDVGANLTLDDIKEDGIDNDAKSADVFKTAEIWEIWCKDERKVHFVSGAYKTAPLKTIDDPLKLIEFWPMPRPMYAICDSDSLDPIALFSQYEEQAKELDRISTRINKITDAIRVRGLYDSTMSELSSLMSSGDNDLVATQNAAAWIQQGGIEKSIWMMPIEGPAKVLQILYQQREATKQVIYELTGIADVMRGASDPNETLGAQQLKAKWGGQRISRMQAEVQRYARDLIRLMAEIVAEKFEPATLLAMTGLKIPTQAEVQAQAMQYQMQAQQAQQQGQQPPPQPKPPEATLEDVMAMLRDDSQRTFRIDVETDSMTSAAMQQEAGEIRELVQGVVELMAGLAPAIQAKSLPIEAAKEIMMAITRRAKMGQAVEDALDKLKEPEPPPDQGQGQMQAEQAKMKQDMQLEQMRMQAEQQAKQMRMQADAQAEMARVQADQAIERMKATYEQQFNQQKRRHANCRNEGAKRSQSKIDFG
jgi:hypothetical protein